MGVHYFHWMGAPACTGVTLALLLWGGAALGPRAQAADAAPALADQPAAASPASESAVAALAAPPSAFH